MTGKEQINLIKQLRAYLYSNGEAGETSDHYFVQGLISGWNFLTAPYILRDDREHRICDKLARRYKAVLRQKPYWTELESGRLFYTA